MRTLDEQNIRDIIYGTTLLGGGGGGPLSAGLEMLNTIFGHIPILL